MTIPYAELQVTSNFSFLRGGSHPQELVAAAKASGLAALAITDRNTLAGVVRAHTAAKQANLRLVIGCRLDLEDGPSLLCLPTDRTAYGRLCRLLTLGQRRAKKGHCTLHLADVAAHAQGQIFIALAPRDWDYRDVDRTGGHDGADAVDASVMHLRAAPVRAVHGARPDAASSPSLEHFSKKVDAGFPQENATEQNLERFPDATQVASALDANDPRGLAAEPQAGASNLAGNPEDADKNRPPPTFGAQLRRLKKALDAPVYLALSHAYRGNDGVRMAALARLASACATPLVATGDVLYHTPDRRPLQDVLTCIRHKCTITNAGFALQANAERHLKSAGEMARLFKGFEAALARTIEILQACSFSLDELVYEYPDEPAPPGKSAQRHLEDLTRDGARERYPEGVPAPVAQTLARELALISQLNYAPYFLTVHDIVRFARTRDILCQGRGSAANSAVCYCLGITNVNPIEIDLLFERFITPERKEPPDIDVDFEHERREEVIQYIYQRYGRERAGLAATVISYRARSAVRDVGKAMGLSLDTVGALAGMVWGTRSGDALPDQHVREAGLDPSDPRLGCVLDLSDALIGFPRHLSQHVGGFVLTRGPLCEVVPIGNAAMADRTFIEWDKDDLDALGLLKIDVLALGMLSCIRRAFGLIETHYGARLTLGSVPREDACVYDMLCRADSIGVFQVESRAQMNMLPRLKPRTFYDLVIEVAIVRPGPIQGNMVHPYLRRRSGLEPEDYPAPSPEFGPPDELRKILGKTKGVPLFQEQAMRIAMDAAQFSADEVNQLRRAMATFRRRGTIGKLEQKMISAMVARGYDHGFAERCFNQIKGFGEYGFPESHAASFAHLVYVSAWLKCHYPEVFACALLNSQPMGFYAPAQIVRDACEHGVEARPADINESHWDSTLEPPSGHTRGGRRALRLGLRQIDGLRRTEAAQIIATREGNQSRGAAGLDRFSSMHALWSRAGVPPATLERLASADAFRSMGHDRRQALWEVRALAHAGPLPLFAWAHTTETGLEPRVALPIMPLCEHVVNDYQTLRLSLKAHPMSFLRDRFEQRGILMCDRVKQMPDGRGAGVAGIVLVRQRPGSAKGVVFMTLEDETGVANCVIWPKTLERFRKVVMGARLIVVHGRLQRHENITHLVASRLEDASGWLDLLSNDAQAMRRPIANADEVPRPEPGSARDQTGPRPRRQPTLEQPTLDAQSQHARGHPRNVRIIPRSRDFH